MNHTKDAIQLQLAIANQNKLESKTKKQNKEVIAFITHHCTQNSIAKADSKFQQPNAFFFT